MKLKSKKTNKTKTKLNDPKGLKMVAGGCTITRWRLPGKEIQTFDCIRSIILLCSHVRGNIIHAW